MQIVSKRVLREFWEIHPQSEQPLRSWFLKQTLSQWKRSVSDQINRTISYQVPIDQILQAVPGSGRFSTECPLQQVEAA